MRPREKNVEPDAELWSDDPRLPALFGAAFAQMVQFAELLAEEGVARGLIGPREVPRLWERHLVNSAAVAAFLPAQGTVVDVGSGAGLPGVVLAAMRPDLRVVLLEPMERRTTWLLEVVAALGLDAAEVVRGRAEDLHGRLEADVVTARAVAPMDRLVAWSLPLLTAGGVLLAMKGSRAAEEVAAAASGISALGGGPAQVLEAPTGPGFAGTSLVRVVRERVVPVPVSTSGSKRPARATKKPGRTTEKPGRATEKSARATNKPARSVGGGAPGTQLSVAASRGSAGKNTRAGADTAVPSATRRSSGGPTRKDAAQSPQVDVRSATPGDVRTPAGQQRPSRAGRAPGRGPL